MRLTLRQTWRVVRGICANFLSATTLTWSRRWPPTMQDHGGVEQFGGVPPYYETRAYVARIVRDFNRKKLAQKSVATQPVAPHKGAPKSPAGSARRTATKQQTPNSSARAKPSSSQQRNE